MLINLLTYTEMATMAMLYIVFFIIGPRYFTHILSEVAQAIICIILIFATLMIFEGIKYYFKITIKPIQTTKAKVISKKYCQRERYDTYSKYLALFLVDNGSKLELNISKKQYKAIKKNDIVELIYQGVIVYSIKNLIDGTVIINKEYAPKNIKSK